METAQNTFEAVKLSKNYLPLNIQFFASSGDGDGGDSGTDGVTNTDGNNNSTADNSTTSDAAKDNDGDDKAKSDSEKLDKIIQSRVDRAMAEERKKSVTLQKKLDKLTKEKLSDEELKQLEIDEREKAIAEKERAITEKENRLLAIKAIKTEGLDDGGDTALELVDLVITGAEDTEETIQAKVKTVSDLFKRMVAAEVDKTFKKNGRNPYGANVSTDKDKTSSIAAKLGKERAEQNKKAADVLNYYTGGKR